MSHRKLKQLGCVLAKVEEIPVIIFLDFFGGYSKTPQNGSYSLKSKIHCFTFSYFSSHSVASNRYEQEKCY